MISTKLLIRFQVNFNFPTFLLFDYGFFATTTKI